MSDFVEASLGFPAVVFTFSLIVVIAYWLFVLLGAADVDILDGDGADPAGDSGGGFLAIFGLGQVPATIVLSSLILVAWFASLAGTVLLDSWQAGGAVRVGLAAGVLIAALLLAWLATRLFVSPLRRLFAAEAPASRTDFVGRVCVIRTGSVTADFGQAEVTAADGSSAIVQVRVPPELAHDPDDLRSGRAALIFEYDDEAEHFLVAPYTEPGAIGSGSMT